MQKDLIQYINNNKPKFALYKEVALKDGTTVCKSFVRYIYDATTIQGAYTRGRYYARKDCHGGLGQIHYDNDYPYAITFENLPLMCYTIKEL